MKANKNNIDQPTLDLIYELLRHCKAAEKIRLIKKVNKHIRCYSTPKSKSKKGIMSRIYATAKESRIEKIYLKIKNTLYEPERKDDYKYFLLYNLDTVDHILARIKIILNDKRQRRYDLGHEISLLHTKISAESSKGIKVRFATILKTELSLNLQYAYKLKKFYEMCGKYYKLKFTTVSNFELLNNLSLLEERMQKDIEFWGPTNNSPTHLTPQMSNITLGDDGEYIEDNYIQGDYDIPDTDRRENTK